MTAATIEQNTDAIVATLEAAEGKTATVRVTGGGDALVGKVKQASDKDGTRRFQVGRRIVSVDTVVDVQTEAPQGDPVVNGQPEAPAGTPTPAEPPAAAAPPTTTPKPPAETVVLTSGKQATGKTITIRCAWVDPDKRTKKQQELFESGFAGVEKGKSYEAMVKAAGNGAKKDESMPDGTERVIKVQDAFQVRFTPENQKKHRNELRRRKSTAKRAARQTAAQAQAATA